MKLAVLIICGFLAVAGKAEEVHIGEDTVKITNDASPDFFVAKPPQRIVGGSVTTINQYPYSTAMLFNRRGQSSIYTQWCGGTILTARAILSAAHCFETNLVVHNAAWWRIRVGSTNANSGGLVYQIDRIVIHGSYNGRDSDVAVLRTNTNIAFTGSIARATIASPTYTLRDNEVVWAIGWGAVYTDGPVSEQLRHVQVWTINQTTCRQRYGSILTERMLCSGWLNVGGRDQCQGDSGGPLIHNGVIVGVCSWGAGCADPYYPGVNARVSSFSNWIVTTTNNI